MCVISMIGQWQTSQWSQQPQINDLLTGGKVSRAEFDALRQEVIALRSLLEAAKKFDQETKQPNCEEEDKVKLIKKVAEAVGVNLKDLLD